MNVLAITCHPDDIETYGGGTVARLSAEGNRVWICHVANGDMGHQEIMPEELGKIREEEAQRAGEALGAEKVYSVNCGDCRFYNDDERARRELVRIIRAFKPDLILTHSEDDYMNDHLEVSRLAFETSFTATVPHMYPEYPACEKIAPIYYIDSAAGEGTIPDIYVDITDYIEQKLRAVGCHESQVKWLYEHDNMDFLEYVRSYSRFRGLQSGVKYAEGFRICKAWPRVTTKRLLP